MKLALTTGSLSRDAGGLFESVRALGKALSEREVDVRIYGLWDKHWELDKKNWLPLEVEAFSYIGPRAAAWSPQMDAALDQAQSDLIHLHGLWQYPSVATRRQWTARRTPYLISPRGMLDAWALANSGWKKIAAAWLFENAVLRDAACLHALCDSEVAAMRNYGLKNRIEIIPNGVNLPELDNAESRKPNKPNEGKRQLLFLGRIHPKKGLIRALRAWAGIQKSKSKNHHSKQWQFVIAGWDQGGHEAELKRLCVELGLKVFSFQGSVSSGIDASDGMIRADLKPNLYKLQTPSQEAQNADVVFVGPAYGADKEALLQSAHAFILPSLSEGLPMSVLEAWAAGLPVVMTPECNLPEGFACRAALEIRNDEDSFRQGLQTLLEMTDGELVEMGLCGRRLVEEKFTWSRVAAQMHRLYKDVMER
jgi:poly(glycerol-phosphate) alpha-glucosyltransferase